MILFFGDSKSKVFAVESSVKLSAENLEKISWALNSSIINKDTIDMMNFFSSNYELTYIMSARDIVELNDSFA